MDQAKKNLIAAEAKALTLFQEIEKQVLIRAGISEEELNKEDDSLNAEDLFDSISEDK